MTSFDTVMNVAGLAIVYLSLFNRCTRQSLHDLATHTFVVSAPGERHGGGWHRLAMALGHSWIDSARGIGLGGIWRTQTNAYANVLGTVFYSGGGPEANSVKSANIVLQKDFSSNGRQTTNILVAKKPAGYDKAAQENCHTCNSI